MTDPVVRRAPGRPDEPVVVIEPARGWLSLNLREVWRHRHVLAILVWRDLKVLYKQTVLGFLWVFLQPFVKMVVFTVVFGRWAGLGPAGCPYPLFVFAGILPWGLFASAVSRCSESVVSQQEFITKVYFPRLIIPLSRVGAALVDFGVSMLLLVALIVYYAAQPDAGVSPSWRLLALAPLTVWVVAAAVGIGTLLAALNVAYRDVRYTVPFAVQTWMFLTPVVYPLSRVPEHLQRWMFLNPMTGVVTAFRWAVLGYPLHAPGLALSAAVSLVLLAAGGVYFRRTERVFADIV